MLVPLLHEVPSGLAAGEVTRSDRLLAREKLDRIPSVNVQVAEEGVLPSRKWEVGRRSSHANVYPHHADFDSTRVLTNGGAVFGEYRCAVAARIAIHNGDSFVQRIHVHYREHRAKNLFAGNAHLGRHVIQDGWPDKIPSCGNSCWTATVYQEFCSLLNSAFDAVVNPVTTRGGDHGP